MDAKRTVVHYGGNGFFVAVSASGHAVALDTNRERNSGPSPVEMLLIGLGACTGVDVVDILRKKRQQVTDYWVEVRGEQREDFPRSFRRIEVRHILRGRGLTGKAVADAIHLSDTKYCSVAATLRPTAEIVSSFEIVNDGGESKSE